MRAAFFSELATLAEKDERIVVLTADLGYLAIEPFSEKFPDRFFNAGISEQNMIGMAAGLAKDGFIPFVYSITPFAVLRPFEFIRNGPIEHQLPVRIIGGGGGIDYSTNGITHYALEDYGVLRTLPGIEIIVPADTAQTETALEKTWNLPGPVYYRIAKKAHYFIPELKGRFELGQPELIRSGSDCLILTIGGLTDQAIAASDLMIEEGLHPSLAVVSSLNFDISAAFVQMLKSFKKIVTIEDHFINNGLGSMAAETIASEGMGASLLRIGFSKYPDGKTGSREFMLRKNELTAEQMARRISDFVK